MIPSTSSLSTTVTGGETVYQNALQSHSDRSSHSNHNHQSSKMISIYNGKRKSSHIYQQQLKYVTAPGVDGIVIRDSGSNLCEYNVNSRCPSMPSHYSNTHDNEPTSYNQQQHAKFYLHPIDRLDETLTCCLPPPSPAPTSDRFVMSMSSQTPAHSPLEAVGFINILQHRNHNNYTNFESPTPGMPVVSGSFNLTSQQQLLSSPSSASIDATTSPGDTSSEADVGDGTCSGAHQLQSVTNPPNIAGLILSQNYSSVNSVSTLQRSISSNLRLHMTDRFRELETKCQLEHAGATSGSSSLSSPSHFVSNSHFLSQNTLEPSDAYSYISSAVHVPVKRYVPTPPTTTELYSGDIPVSMQLSQPPDAAVSRNSSAHQHPLAQQHAGNMHTTSALPYHGFRTKCCADSSQQQKQLTHIPAITNQSSISQHHDHRGNMATSDDYYASSPRSRLPYKCNGKNMNAGVFGSDKNSLKDGKESPLIMLNEPQQLFGNIQVKSCSASTASSATSSSYTGNTSVLSPVTNSRQTTTLESLYMFNDYVSRAPSIEYLNTLTNSSNKIPLVGRVMTPINVIPALDLDNAGVSAVVDNNFEATGTCLHCNTMRRTTGVHQTTQTTGPISPVPTQQQQQFTNNSVYSNNNHPNLELTLSMSTPSTSESNISPRSSNLELQQQKVPNIDQAKSAKFQEHSQLNQHQQFQQQPQRYEHQQNYTQQQLQLHQRQILSSQDNVIERNLNNVHQYQSEDTPQLPLKPSQDLQTRYHQQQSTQLHHQSLLLQQQKYSRKQQINQYVCKEVAKFFGVDVHSEAEERAKWCGRQRRLALRRFGALRLDSEISSAIEINSNDASVGYAANNEDIASLYRRNCNIGLSHGRHYHNHQHASDRPDILPAQDAESTMNEFKLGRRGHQGNKCHQFANASFHIGDHMERKASVPSMFIFGLTYIIQTLKKSQPKYRRQWSRSFAPAHVTNFNSVDDSSEICLGLMTLQVDEVFFDSVGSDQGQSITNGHAAMSDSSTASTSPASGGVLTESAATSANSKPIEHQRQLYIGERVHGWRTSGIVGMHAVDHVQPMHQQQQQTVSTVQQFPNQRQQRSNSQFRNGMRCNRIASQILDDVLENSRRSPAQCVKLFSTNDLDDRNDHRPFFTYWINTVQILVLFLSLICYGIGPIGFGVEEKTGQVLVTSLSLQTVQHQEQRNVWIGPRNSDLVHLGAKFASCMRRDVRIVDVLLKTRQQERETACCIRNDDSGCVQSSQADCSVRGLFPTKSVSTWKKWSPGESGPGGRISGSVCGLDPKYCDAPASIAPYEWPDDITKWPICRKTNSFSRRFRFKDHTAEHMVCEVIGHPCCTGVFGECRITTREYCDFVSGYFYEEASLCSQISCLNNVCGMFSFVSIEVPDQLYRLFTSLCLHAGVVHLAITVAFQHIFLADLERLIGPIRTAIVYIGSGIAGNLTSAVLMPYSAEVGPLASLSGVVSSLVVLLILMHWKQLHKPHMALFKLIFIGALLFAVGTLPWQLNIAGLLAGVICGVFLTVALVPFVSITKYGKKVKINMIWSCIVFHLFVYSVMLIIFYLFPMELTNLSFGEVFSGHFNAKARATDNTDVDAGLGGSSSRFESFSNTVTTSYSKKHHQQQQQQYHHHHYSDDIIGNNALNSDISSLSHLLQSQVQPKVYFNMNYYTGRRANTKSNSKVNSKIFFYEKSKYNFSNNDRSSDKKSNEFSKENKNKNNTQNYEYNSGEQRNKNKPDLSFDLNSYRKSYNSNKNDSSGCNCNKELHFFESNNTSANGNSRDNSGSKQRLEAQNLNGVAGSIN